VLVRGRRAPIVGAVSMDMMALDVTGMGVEPGDEVVLTGRQGNEEITFGDMSRWVSTIPYELLCRVGSRVERVYLPPAP
jgi:alanine racemase